MKTIGKKTIRVDGESLVKGKPVFADDIKFLNDQDFTFEFWFNLPTAQDACLISNGKGDMSDNVNSSWAINATANGTIEVLNN